MSARDLTAIPEDHDLDESLLFGEGADDHADAAPSEAGSDDDVQLEDARAGEAAPGAAPAGEAPAKFE